MTFNKFSTICTLFIVIFNFSCSPEGTPSENPTAEKPEVTFKTPIDADGILNKMEADALVVKGKSTLEDGYLVTVLISDGQNTIAGNAVVKEEEWTTETLSISGFNNGKITVKADGVNEAGRLSNTAETTLYLDQDPPTINITGHIAGNDSIDSNEATAVVVKGTSDAANGQSVLVTFGDENSKYITTETKVNSGQWQAEVDVSSFKSGSLMLMAEVTDIAGNPATEHRSGIVLE